jgi:hypothetical protein
VSRNGAPLGYGSTYKPGEQLSVSFNGGGKALAGR